MSEPTSPGGSAVVAPEPLPPPGPGLPGRPQLPWTKRPLGRRHWISGALLVCLLVFGPWAISRLRSPASPPGAPDAREAAPARSNVPPVLAETVGEEGHLGIAVVSLERVGPDMVELRLAVTNTSAAGAPALDIAQRFSADGPDRGTLAEVYLADLSHEHKFFILRDARNAPIGSREATPLAAGERRILWARYPAPAEDEAEVVVHVPHADPMPNVPVAKRATP